MKAFLISILLCLSILTYGQMKCGVPITTATFSFTKPVVANQVIGSLKVCDEDFNQAYGWSITSGNSSRYWKVAVNPNDPSKGDIMVNTATAATNINKSTTKTFTIVVVASDNGVPIAKSLACTVKMSPVSAPAEVLTYTFNFTKPVVSRQLIGSIVPINAGFTAPITWTIISGNSAKLWNIAPYPNSCDVVVNYTATAAANINKGTTVTYTIKITATDGVKTSTYTVKLTVIQ